MSKELKSRQDVLDVWVSKGANLGPFTETKEVVYVNNVNIDIVGEAMIYCCTIYEILYAPESNFFEVMFPLRERQKPIDGGLHPNTAKEECVTANDPLQYLLENLNETTS